MLDSLPALAVTTDGTLLSEADLRRLRDVAIEVLGHHRLLTMPQAVKSRCSCGWQWQPATDYTTHLAAALVGEDIATDLIDCIASLLVARDVAHAAELSAAQAKTAATSVDVGAVASPSGPALCVEYADGQVWRELSLPDTLGTAQRHARRQAAYVQGTARVRDRNTDTVSAVYVWQPATHRVTRVATRDGTGG